MVSVAAASDGDGEGVAVKGGGNRAAGVVVVAAVVAVRGGVAVAAAAAAATRAAGAARSTIAWVTTQAQQATRWVASIEWCETAASEHSVASLRARSSCRQGRSGDSAQ